MAKKRERKPQEPIESIFEEQPEIVPIRETQSDALPAGGELDAFSGILDIPKHNHPYSSQAPPDLSQANEAPGTVSDYIRRQVLTDMYGTENPSEYDKISLAIKRLL